MSKKSEFISAVVTPETKKSIEKMAKKEDRTTSYIINKALEEYIKNHGEE